ncbi:MAG: phosphoribosylformylglycinamidine synthase I [Ilumatobacteraceae bacterium]
MKPSALVISAPGTNRDNDAMLALQLAGASVNVMSIKALISSPQHIENSQMIVIPGGFSYADALGAGRLFAHDIIGEISDALKRAVEQGRPIIGICNGFQVLVRAGILPGGSRRVALGPNIGGNFDCRWVRLTPSSQRCIWTRSLNEEIECPIAHGEGRFTCEAETYVELVDNDQIALRYASANPNGSTGAVAGICDESGFVLGLMPHPENHILERQHPQFHRGVKGHLGLNLFKQGVAFVNN